MGLQGTFSVGLLCVSWTDAEKETVGTSCVAQGCAESKMSLSCSCLSLCRAQHGCPSRCCAFRVKAGEEAEPLSPGEKRLCTACDHFCVCMDL